MASKGVGSSTSLSDNEGSSSSSGSGPSDPMESVSPPSELACSSGNARLNLGMFGWVCCLEEHSWNAEKGSRRMTVLQREHWTNKLQNRRSGNPNARSRITVQRFRRDLDKSVDTRPAIMVILVQGELNPKDRMFHLHGARPQWCMMRLPGIT